MAKRGQFSFSGNFSTARIRGSREKRRRVDSGLQLGCLHRKMPAHYHWQYCAKRSIISRAEEAGVANGGNGGTGGDTSGYQSPGTPGTSLLGFGGGGSGGTISGRESGGNGGNVLNLVANLHLLL